MISSILIATGIFIISAKCKIFFSKSNLTAIFGIIILSLFSMLFDWNILFSGRIGIAENLMALYDDATTGYLEEASKADSVVNYMKNFSEKQKKNDFINHCITNPPARTILCIFIYKFNYHYPLLRNFITKTMPSEAHNAFKIFKEENLFPRFKMNELDQASGILILYVFILLILIGKIFCAIIIFRLYGRETSLNLAPLYLFLPAPILLLGHYDCFFFSISAFLMILAIFAIEKKSATIFAITGFTACLSTLISIAFGVSCLWVILFFLFYYTFKKENKNELLKAILLFSISYIIAIMILLLFFNFNYFEVLLNCLRNNSLFYAKQTNRTIEWKLVNYFEFALAVGLPTALLAFYVAIKNFRSLKEKINYFEANKKKGAAIFASLISLIFLIFTPTRGEVFRLWTPAIPFFLIILPELFNEFKEKKGIAIFSFGFLTVIQIVLMRYFIKIVIIENL